MRNLFGTMLLAALLAGWTIHSSYAQGGGGGAGGAGGGSVGGAGSGTGGVGGTPGGGAGVGNTAPGTMPMPGTTPAAPGAGSLGNPPGANGIPGAGIGTSNSLLIDTNLLGTNFGPGLMNSNGVEVPGIGPTPGLGATNFGPGMPGTGISNAPDNSQGGVNSPGMQGGPRGNSLGGANTGHGTNSVYYPRY